MNYYITNTLVYNNLKMNLQLLPREIQNLINEFNVQHRPQMKQVLEELLETQPVIYSDEPPTCSHCGADAVAELSTHIMSHRFDFCSFWCRNDAEKFMRWSYACHTV